MSIEWNFYACFNKAWPKLFHNSSPPECLKHFLIKWNLRNFNKDPLRRCHEEFPEFCTLFLKRCMFLHHGAKKGNRKNRWKKNIYQRWEIRQMFAATEKISRLWVTKIMIIHKKGDGQSLVWMPNHLPHN